MSDRPIQPADEQAPPPAAAKPGYRPAGKINDPAQKPRTDGSRPGDDSINLPALVLVSVGDLLLVVGALILFTTKSIFVAVLAGAFVAVGGAFLAGHLVSRAIRATVEQ